MKSVPAIAFDYRPSRWLISAVAVTAVLACVSIAICGLSFGFKLVLGALAAAYAIWALRSLSYPPFIRIVWHAAGHWRLASDDANERVGELARAVVLGVLVVLTLKVDSRRTTALVLFTDNCDVETRRKLRVRLARADSFGEGT